MANSVFYSKYSDMDGLPLKPQKPPSKLMHSLFELCVVVGMDEDTRLVEMSRVTC